MQAIAISARRTTRCGTHHAASCRCLIAHAHSSALFRTIARTTPIQQRTLATHTQAAPARVATTGMARLAALALPSTILHATATRAIAATIRRLSPRASGTAMSRRTAAGELAPSAAILAPAPATAAIAGVAPTARTVHHSILSRAIAPPAPQATTHTQAAISPAHPPTARTIQRLSQATYRSAAHVSAGTSGKDRTAPLAQVDSTRIKIVALVPPDTEAIRRVFRTALRPMIATTTQTSSLACKGTARAGAAATGRTHRARRARSRTTALAARTATCA